MVLIFLFRHYLILDMAKKKQINIYKKSNFTFISVFFKCYNFDNRKYIN
jgi:hypothetical protein